MTRTTTGTFELFITEGGINDGLYPFAVELTANYQPGRPALEPSLASPGEPAEGPEVELTKIEVVSSKSDASRADLSFLLDILPQSITEKWELKLCENAGTLADDKGDWEQDQERGQDETKKRFDMLSGKKGI